MTKPETLFAESAELVADPDGVVVHRDDEPTWLAARRQGIGASETAAVMGLDHWKSALEIYADKVVEVDHDVGELGLWGNLLERPVLAEYGRRTEREIRYGGVLLRSRAHPLLMATLDAEQMVPDENWTGAFVLRDHGIADAKVTSRRDFPTHREDELPVDIQIQIQHQLIVTAALIGTVVWLPLPSRRLGWRDLAPHPEFQTQIVEEVEAFWVRVVERRPPDPDGTDSSKRALRALYAEDEGAIRELAGDGWRQAYDELAELAEARAESKKREEALKQVIQAEMAEATFATLDDGRYFSFKTTRGAKLYECSGCGHRQDKADFRVLRRHKAPKSRRQPEEHRAKRLKD